MFKKIPTKNYVIVAVVSVVVIIVLLYARTLYLNNRDTVNSISIFNEKESVISQINIEDLDFVVSESNDAIIYISYTGNNKIKNLERKLYKEIIRNDLADKVIYLDITNKLENDEYIKILKEKLPNISFDISTAPIMIYVKEGQALEAVNSEFKTIDFSVMQKLINKYENE